MDKNSIIVGTERTARDRAGAPAMAWGLVLWFGVLFTLVGATDLLLGLLPSDWASASGRFTALSGAAGGLPILTLGLVTVSVAALATGARRVAAFAGVLSLLMAVLIVVGLLVVLMVRSETLADAPQVAVPVIHTAVRRTLLFGVTMAGVLALTGITALVNRGADET